MAYTKQHWNTKLQLTADDIRQEFDALGIKVEGSPNADGWQSCYCVTGGKDTTPSGSVNYLLGKYHDHRLHENGVQSLPELMVDLGYAATVGEAKASLKAKYRPAVAKKLCFVPQDNPAWIADFLAKRPGITSRGVERSAGQTGMFGDTPVIALPIYDRTPTMRGVYLLRVDGLSIGEGKARVLKEKGAPNGLLGTHLLAAADISAVYWVEGGTDYLAALGACEYPNEVFLANPSGCGEQINEEQAAIIRAITAPIYVIGDSDTPGDLAAAKRAEKLRQLGKQAYHLRLPYEITPSHGKDLRDWLQVAYVPTQPLHEQLTNVQAEGDSAAKKLLDLLDAEIIASADDRCCLYNRATGRVLKRGFTILKYEEIASCLGGKFLSNIRRNYERDDRISFDEFLNAITFLHSTLTYDQRVQLAGPGIWRTKAKTWALLQTGDTLEWDGNTLIGHTLSSLPGLRPHQQDLEWFNRTTLATELVHAQAVEYRQAVVTQLDGWFGSWPWVDPMMPKLLTGLYLAAWIQHGWPKRPYVVLGGESATGKTSLLRLLRGLYNGLATEVAAPTPAGFVQEFQSSMRIALVDEIDAIRDFEGFYKLLRTTSTGQTTVRGTPQQVANTLKLHHLIFLSGITCQTLEQADLNRYVSLELRRDSGTRFVEPSDVEIENLGTRALASVLAVADEALTIFPSFTLPPQGEGGERARIWETHAIPFVMRAVMLGQTLEEGRNTAETFWGKSAEVNSVLALTEDVSPHRQLLRDILNQRVRVTWADRNEASVMDLIGGSEGLGVPERRELAKQFHTYGVRLTHDDCLGFVHVQMVRPSGLLYNTAWRNQALRKHLLRLDLPVSTSSARRVGQSKGTEEMLKVPVTALREFLGISQEREKR